LENNASPGTGLRYDGPANAWANASLVVIPATPEGCATAPLASVGDEWTMVKESNPSRAKALCVLLAPSDLPLNPGVTLDEAITVTNLLAAAFSQAPSDAYVCNVNPFGS
jgi:hypothetical protein